MDRKKIVAVVIFLTLLEFKFVYIPMKKRITSLDKLIVAKNEDKEILLKLCEEYREKGIKGESLKVTRKEFSLLSYIGNLIEKRNLERNITGLQPLRTDKKGNLSVERVRIGLKGITLQQLYGFLYDIEKAQDGIYISDFRMQKEKDTPYLLDIEMELFVAK
ncbi:MAG: hypothetical protein NC905_03390 [Candidatus Omnitrophica bacterium]|nr:hypothetical protein [Candidatus Omnitrophota bacterium]MCM8777290.1 hypothetical protein [Candidatus Omnitrophota bacterium]